MLLVVALESESCNRRGCVEKSIQRFAETTLQNDSAGKYFGPKRLVQEELLEVLRDGQEHCTLSASRMVMDSACEWMNELVSL